MDLLFKSFYAVTLKDDMYLFIYFQMKMSIYRPNNIEYSTIEVDLIKKVGKGLGLSVVARKSGKGVYIADIVSENVFMII